MAIKINYLELKSQENINLGQIEFFDTYIPPSASFPYFYMAERSQNLNYESWEELVPFLYDQKIKIINDVAMEDENKYIEKFSIYSFTANNGTISLKFTDINSIKILSALNEDRKLSFVENNSYAEWKKTLTPINDISNNNIVFLQKDFNYYINNITINQNDVIVTVSSTILNNVNSEHVLDEIYVEFGPYRIPNKTRLESVFFSGLKGKYFMNNKMNEFVTNLGIRSQIIGHTHQHTHLMREHTHGFNNHAHNMSNHTHGMQHQHNYTDSFFNTVTLMVGTMLFTNYDIHTPLSNILANTNPSSQSVTGETNINITGPADIFVTDSISNNLTSGILLHSITPDFINSNENSLKINKNISPETYPVYAYIYGKIYKGA